VGNDVILVLVVITALAFDFTNGFHDTGNAMATSIATGALSPRLAVALSGVLNLVGAFLSLAVAATIASGLVDTKVVTLTVVAAGLTGGIIWYLLTWLLGIPSSSSHALIGGVIGATLAAAGGSAVLWHGLVSKVILPAALSPVIAGLVAALSTWLLYRISRSLAAGARNHGFRVGQVGSACMVSLAHGTNDAQKTMGRGRPDGQCVAAHAALFGPGRSGCLCAGQRHRRQRGRHRRLAAPGRVVRIHLLVVPLQQGRSQQRQRRVGGNGRPGRTQHAAAA
jgi:PiT family inorganic phosphate transporter